MPPVSLAQAIAAPPPTARIIVFPSRRGGRLTTRDRMAALRWMDQSGYTRLAFDSSGDRGSPELGDFILIYRRNVAWSAWGVGCCDGGFMVWRPGSGATTGWFDHIGAALASIPGAGEQQGRGATW